MLPEPRPRGGARFGRHVFAPISYRHALVILSALVAWLLVSPVEAEFPSRGAAAPTHTRTRTTRAISLRYVAAPD